MNAAKQEAELVAALIDDVRRMRLLTAQLPPNKARLAAEMRGVCQRGVNRLRRRREDLRTYLTSPETPLPDRDREYIADLVDLLATAESDLNGAVRA
jgi:hypothetical protein